MFSLTFTFHTHKTHSQLAELRNMHTTVHLLNYKQKHILSTYTPSRGLHTFRMAFTHTLALGGLTVKQLYHNIGLDKNVLISILSWAVTLSKLYKGSEKRVIHFSHNCVMKAVIRG